jgi:hypothetical protein
VGAGLELGMPRVLEHTVSVDDTTFGISSTTTVSRRLRPALYGRAGGSLVLRLTPAWALVSRLEMRATTGDGLSWLMTAMLGPRYTLP